MYNTGNDNYISVDGELVSNAHIGRYKGQASGAFKILPTGVGGAIQVFCRGKTAEKSAGRKKTDKCIVSGYLYKSPENGVDCIKAKKIIWLRGAENE